MLRPRVIPVLLLKGRGVYKTVGFKDPKYVGDPINALRIFAEKEADEVMVLDISASHDGADPQFDLIRDLAGECFMPLSYGGGVRSVDQVRTILKLGVEKIVLNTTAHKDPELITRIAAYGGSSAVVVCIDAKRKLLGGYEGFVRGGREATGRDPVQLAREAARRGAGEIVINSIDRDGRQNGYDLDLVGQVAGSVDVPVVACGGAGTIDHIREVISRGAAAAAAGSMFVFQGRHRAVLISYLRPEQIDTLLIK